MRLITRCFAQSANIFLIGINGINGKIDKKRLKVAKKFPIGTYALFKIRTYVLS